MQNSDSSVKVPILLVTANVGSLFEDVSILFLAVKIPYLL